MVMKLKRDLGSLREGEQRQLKEGPRTEQQGWQRNKQEMKGNWLEKVDKKQRS